jgi:hydrogenase nickel incorporation protein HypB
VDFDVARCIAFAQRVNPGIEVLLLSARSGQGMEAWLEWLLQGLPTSVLMPAVTGHAHVHALEEQAP